jgi:hypothetical protein
VIDTYLKQLLQNASTDRRSSWAIVRNGAVAEFSVIPGELTQRVFDHDTKTLIAITERGILEVKMSDSLIAVVTENASYKCSPWSQNIYLCVPKKESELPVRNTLTQIGEYKKNNISGIIWDLGIGYRDFQAKIIVNNDDLQYHLKQKEGQSIIDDPKFLEVIVEYSPYRLFDSKFASILVKQKIAPNKDEVDGPHTHLLPDIILGKIIFPNPINEELSSQIQVDPIGGAIDGNGNYKEWLGFEKDDFQQLLKKYGDKIGFEEKITFKNMLTDLLRKDDIASIVNMYDKLSKQDIIRIILAQIVCDNGYESMYRKRGLEVLEKLNAINFPILKSWAMKFAPEIIK